MSDIACHNLDAMLNVRNGKQTSRAAWIEGYLQGVQLIRSSPSEAFRKIAAHVSALTT